jgi:hypothetical protein
MSLQSVRQFFAEHAPDIDIIELIRVRPPLPWQLPRIMSNPGKSPRPFR